MNQSFEYHMMETLLYLAVSNPIKPWKMERTTLEEYNTVWTKIDWFKAAETSWKWKQ